MRKLIGTLVLLTLALAFVPAGQRLLAHQIAAWVIRDGGFREPPDQVVAVGELQGYYFAPEPGQPTLFFAHGNSSRHARQVTRLAPALAAGYGLYYVTYPGFDQNLRSEEGWGVQLFSEAGGKQAFVDHWAAYKALGGQPGTTILAAESLGTAMMPWFLSQLPEDERPPLMVIMAGFDEITRVAQAKTFGLVGPALIYDDFDNAGVWEGLETPIYIANGDSDWLVSPEHGRRIARRVTAPAHFQLYEDYGHLNLPLGQVILDAVNHFQLTF